MNTSLIDNKLLVMHDRYMTTFSLSPIETLSISVLVVWTLFWKGIALWKAAREQDKVWFIVLLILNTIGILEILYIFVFSKHQKSSTQQ